MVSHVISQTRMVWEERKEWTRTLLPLPSHRFLGRPSKPHFSNLTLPTCPDDSPQHPRPTDSSSRPSHVSKYRHKRILNRIHNCYVCEHLPG